MKEQIQMPTKYIIILGAIFLIGAIIAFFYFRKNHLYHKREISDLVSKELNGQINILENRNRGSYNLQIGNYKINSLPIAFEVEKYKIKLGDSISKEANSHIMIFYRNKNGTLEKYCEYEIIQ
jgi:predicted membrane protein